MHPLSCLPTLLLSILLSLLAAESLKFVFPQLPTEAKLLRHT
jgi:hypothetical protein